MAFKFPFTNYHELNLTWVLEQLKKLFEESEENVQTIETYDDRLSAVETEVTDLESTTTQAINTANAAATNAAAALSRANTANQNALTASSQAGAAVTAAQESQQEAQAATQAAQQAQATAMTFDGRITQAQNDASAAVHEAESFENRVNAAINTANNAANTATIAQGIAVNANQTAAQALDELNAQRGELESIAAGLIDDINDEADAEKQDIQNLADSVIASIPSDYTQLSADVKNKAPLIVTNASGEVVAIKDGADNMEIRRFFAKIKPIQQGTGTPSPSNIRQILPRTHLNAIRAGKNLISIIENGAYTTEGTKYSSTIRCVSNLIPIKKGEHYALSYTLINSSGKILRASIQMRDASGNRTFDSSWVESGYVFVAREDSELVNITFGYSDNTDINASDIKAQLELNTISTDYNIPSVQNISVDWETEAGNIYGGSILLNTGNLVSDFDTVVYSSASGFTSHSSGRWYYYGLPNGLDFSRRFESISNQAIYKDEVSYSPYFAFGSAGLYINKLSENETLEDFSARLSANPLQICYPVGTPSNYSLSPISVNTVLGDNTIYSDCGPVSIDYPADTKLYIDGKFAELQALVLEN